MAFSRRQISEGWVSHRLDHRAELHPHDPSHAARALPQIVASIVALMAFCGGLAFLLSHQLGIDPLTAYLATSPGGMDSVAIIAAASDSVDLSFVMALQSARFLIVLLLGPSLARLVTSWVRE